MFLRTHRVGRSVYTEALESYRDPIIGKPKHRCIARWRDRSFAVALAEARAQFGNTSESRAYWQGILDGTVRPRVRGLRHRSPDKPREARRNLAVLDQGVAHLAGLEAVHAKLAPAAEADIQAATEAVRLRMEQNRQETKAFTPPAPPP
jgi:cobalamin biosynthesis protein CobT